MKYEKFKDLIEHLKSHYIKMEALREYGVDVEIASQEMQWCVDILIGEVFNENEEQILWDEFFGVKEYADIDDAFIVKLWDKINAIRQ